MKHLMIDLETLGLTPGSVILSVGAVLISGKGETILDTYHGKIPLEDSLKYGFKVDGPTIEWWFSQTKEAQDVFCDPRYPLFQVLHDLDRIVDSMDWKNVLVWSNPAHFDVVMLEEAYRRVHRVPPWTYQQVRCFRTIRKWFSDIEPPKEFEGVRHNAFYDAKHQALHLMRILQNGDRRQILSEGNH